MKIKEGETSLDRLYSLGRVACVGCCTGVPVVVIDEVRTDLQSAIEAST